MFSLNEKNFSLKQGKKYKDYQNDYTHIIGTKRLDLIEKTSDNNLGFIEGLKNPLEVENNKVKEKLKDLENQFNTTLALYTNQYQRFLTKLMNEQSELQPYLNKNVKQNNGKFYTVNRFGVARGYSKDAWANKPSSCPSGIPNDSTIKAFNYVATGLDYVPGQPCDLDGSIIKNNDTNEIAWVDEKGEKHIYPDEFTYEQTQKNGGCPSNIHHVSNEVFNMFASGSAMNEHSSCETNIDQQLLESVKASNQKLLNIANEMYQETVKLEHTEKQVEDKSEQTRKILLDQIQSLNKERDELQKAKNYSAMFNGELDDSNLQINREYYHYLVWIIAAVTLGGITMHQIIK